MAERIEILQINQPQCANVFGEEPCTATGEPCFNTLTTCKDTANYSVAEEPLKIYLHTECENPTFIAGMFPTMQSFGRREGILNIGSADPDKQPLGVRDVGQAVIKDHPYHDRYTDPYARQRSYNPMAQGTFWAKWLARNDNYEGMEAIYYVGQVGDLLGDMVAINYEIQRIDGPGSDGMVTIEVADVLRRADNNKATIPKQSRGTLTAALNSSATTFSITTPSSSDLDDYPEEGKVIISNEKMSYTRVGYDFTVTRGIEGSSPEEHEEGEVVQAAYDIDDMRVDAILYDWLINIVGVPSEWITFADWEEEAETWLPTYSFTTTIWRPVGANQIIGELLRDSSAYLIPDLEQKKLLFRAIRPATLVKSVTDTDNIVLGSFQIKRKPEIRLTQIWLNYAMRDTLESATDRSNFSRLSVRLSDDVSTVTVQKIKEIFSRFFGAGDFTQVNSTTRRIMERFQGVQSEYHFALEGDDAIGFGLGDVCVIRHRELQDIYGAVSPTSAQVISVKQTERGGIVEYRAQPFAFDFTQRLIAPDDVPNWTASTDDQLAKYMYISDDDGLMSDGEPGPTIPS